MSHLPEFISLEEKSRRFDHIVVETESQLEEFIHLIDNEQMLFRGVNEAKFKLYSTLQRFWIKNDLDPNVQDYQKFIINLINEFKDQNERLFAQYIGLFKATFIEYGVLSTIQHYGGLTPLIDFTELKSMALYFAAQLDDYNVQTREIDKYCSVYIVRKGAVGHTTDYFTRVNSKIKIEYSQIIEEAKEHFAGSGISKQVLVKALDQSHFENLNLISIMNQWKAGLIADFDEAYEYGFGTRTNLNILIQKGVFLFNYHPVQTLEESMDEFLIETLKNGGLSREKIDEQRKRIKQLKCYDINKSLIPALKAYLDNLGINNSKLFPNIPAMVRLAEKMTLNSVIKY